MKVIYSISIIGVAVYILALSVFVEASKVDERVELSARQSYLFKTYLQGDDIKIESKDGAVTLTGTVSDESHKSMAQETVTSLPGVKSVDNRLDVKGERPAEKSDTWITAKVKTALLFHKSVSAITEVITKDGVVTLKGEAANQAEKDLTTEYAKDVDGVKDVKNEMIVAKTMKKPTEKAGEYIDDASITAQVKLSLLYHRSTSGLKTKVETNNGNVTLYGKANNAAELSLASKLASDVKGVKDVKNEMTIE